MKRIMTYNVNLIHEVTYLHVFFHLLYSCRDAKGGHYFGGQLVDKAITATFAALVWHSQEIREELVNNCESCYCMCNFRD